MQDTVTKNENSLTNKPMICCRKITTVMSAVFWCHNQLESNWKYEVVPSLTIAKHHIWNVCVVKQVMISCIKPCPHCRIKVRLSQKTARQRRQSHFSVTVALFCDSVDRL